MGWWDFEQMGFRCDADNREQVKKLLDCCGVDFRKRYETNVQRFCTLTFDGFGEYLGSRDPDIVYAIVNKMFGDVTIFFESENGNSVSDYYNRYEKLYDPVEKTIYIGEAEFCDGGNEVFGESVFYTMIKEACEEAAKDKGIPVKWERGNPYEPSGDEFRDICREVLDEHGGISELGRKTYSEPIPEVEIDTDTIYELIDDVTMMGHDSLAALIRETFDVD